MSSAKGLYIYRRLDNDKQVRLHMTQAEMLSRQDVLRRITLDDGAEAVRDIAAENTLMVKRAGRLKRATFKPIISIASGVHPEQIEEFREWGKKAGVGDVEYTKNGDPILTSLEQQSRYNKARGIHNNDSYRSH